MSVREELAGCIGLQHLLEQRAALRREMDTPPEELVALRQALATRRESLGAKQKRRRGRPDRRRPSRGAPVSGWWNLPCAAWPARLA